MTNNINNILSVVLLLDVKTEADTTAAAVVITAPTTAVIRVLTIVEVAVKAEPVTAAAAAAGEKRSVLLVNSPRLPIRSQVNSVHLRCIRLA